ncbi:hypothetical protein EGW08_013449 [Elysia chlorotica]|uniref:Endonuclease/exonuclease/phosphatase domain-containing protein n=1 Tax=Elysia chlorotica TaxID=188477 RepID=A0A3S1B901_ELYCH|nr:hypothetical protein EGW08_013449 [Elysia chlorotica]
MTCAGESSREACVPTTLLTTKNKTRIWTWNIRTLYETGRTAQACREMDRFNSKDRRVTITHCYAPTNVADIEDTVNFYEHAQTIIDKVPKRDMKILSGDFNTKVGIDNTNLEYIMGIHSTVEQNENGEFFTEFCSFNDLVIGGTLFPRKNIHKTTWISRDGKTENQIDHTPISRKWGRSLHDVRVKGGAAAASDHHLVAALLKTKIKSFNESAGRPAHKYNIREKQKSDHFKIKMRKRFSVLSYYQKRQSTNSDEVCERHGRRHVQLFGSRSLENTRSGSQLTPGHAPRKGRT